MENINKFTFDEDIHSEGVSLKCPSCGSPLSLDPETQMFLCSACNSSFSKKQIQNKTYFTENDDMEEFDDVIKEYSCPSCGAEIISDENTSTDFCAYCGNPVVLKGRVSGQIKPNLIIPFRINKENAKKMLFEYLSSKKYIPNSFFEKANLDKITGIYYPFWETDANTDSAIKAECTKVSSWSSGDKRYTKTSYYNVIRRGNIHFEDITVNALKSADKTLVEGVLPYPIDEHIPFEMSYLSGFYAKKNDLTFDEVKNEVGIKIKKYSNSILKNTISGYTSVNINDSSIKLLNYHKDYTLLPIWILSYKYDNKNYTFALNGSTGKIFGDLPISHKKLRFSFFGFLVMFFVIFALLGGLIL